MNQNRYTKNKIKFDNKGFTLVEMLAVVVILSIVIGVATNGVISYINTSKEKSEKVFTNKLSRLIDEYLDLYGPKLQTTGEAYEFMKARTSSRNSEYKVEAYQLISPISESDPTTSIHINDLVKAKIIDAESLINPKNKKRCFNAEKNPEIKVYKDNEYVYYYYVDLSGSNTACEISNTNSLISTMSNNLIESLLLENVTLPDALKEKVGK